MPRTRKERHWHVKVDVELDERLKCDAEIIDAIPSELIRTGTARYLKWLERTEPVLRDELKRRRAGKARDSAGSK